MRPISLASPLPGSSRRKINKGFNSYGTVSPVSRHHVAKWLSVLLAFCLGLAASPAHAMTFSFSFTDDGTCLGGGIGSTVTGTISGLQDNLTNQQATSVVITSAAGLGGVPVNGSPSDFDATTWNNIFSNTFDVSGGAITAALFEATDNSGLLADLDQLCIGSPPVSCSGLAGNLLTYNLNTDVIANTQGLAGVTFAAVAVPVPAAVWLFGSVLGLLGWMQRKAAQRVSAN